MKIKINYFAAMLLAMFAGGGIGAQGAEQPKKATSHTIEYNQKFLGAHGLDENDKQDFQDAEKGFMATLKDPNIKNKEGRTVFDISAFDFTKDKPAPDTVNPSLWRVSQLNAKSGLFKVMDGIYQIRGFDQLPLSVFGPLTAHWGICRSMKRLGPHRKEAAALPHGSVFLSSRHGLQLPVLL